MIKLVFRWTIYLILNMAIAMLAIGRYGIEPMHFFIIGSLLLMAKYICIES